MAVRLDSGMNGSSPRAAQPTCSGGHHADPGGWLEAKQRLEALAAAGPTPRAFTFKSPFTSAAGVALEIREVSNSRLSKHTSYTDGVRTSSALLLSISPTARKTAQFALCYTRAQWVRSVTLRR